MSIIALILCDYGYFFFDFWIVSYLCSYQMYQCIIIITEVYESVARNSTHEWADILKYVGGIEKKSQLIFELICMHACSFICIVKLQSFILPISFRYSAKMIFFLNPRD